MTKRITGVLAAVAAWCAALSATGGELRHFSFHLSGGRLVEPDNTVRVVEGDTVALTWTADQRAELHLHGYDLVREVAPGTSARMRFEAAIQGRFPVEIHRHEGGHRVVLYVEVHPD